MPHRPYNKIRGTNVLPMVGSSHSLHLALVPMRLDTGFPDQTRDGFFSTVHADSEIAQMGQLGINSARVWGSFMGWFIDPAGYMRNLEYYCQKLAMHGMGMQYILFNGTPAGLASADITLGAGGIVVSGGNTAHGTLLANWTLANSWQSHPLCPRFPAGGRQLSHWPEPYAAAEWTAHGPFNPTGSAYDSRVLQYVQHIADFLANNPWGRMVDDGVDLYNEANITSADATRWRNVRLFIKRCGDEIRAISPRTRLGVGMAGIPGAGGDWRTLELVQVGVPIDFISIHCYDPLAVAAFVAAGREEAVRCNLHRDAVMFSECYILPADHDRMTLYTQALAAAGVGGYLWSVLRNNVYTGDGPIDGRMECSTPAQQLRSEDPSRWRPVEHADLTAERAWYAMNYV